MFWLSALHSDTDENSYSYTTPQDLRKQVSDHSAWHENKKKRHSEECRKKRGQPYPPLRSK